MVIYYEYAEVKQNIQFFSNFLQLLKNKIRLKKPHKNHHLIDSELVVTKLYL